MPMYFLNNGINATTVIDVASIIWNHNSSLLGMVVKNPPWYMAAMIATPNSRELFSILDPRTFAIAIAVPAAPFLANIIIEIFSGISPAMQLKQG